MDGNHLSVSSEIKKNPLEHPNKLDCLVGRSSLFFPLLTKRGDRLVLLRGRCHLPVCDLAIHVGNPGNIYNLAGFRLIRIRQMRIRLRHNRERNIIVMAYRRQGIAGPDLMLSEYPIVRIPVSKEGKEKRRKGKERKQETIREERMRERAKERGTTEASAKSAAREKTAIIHS